jgi:hypothetical protein
MKYWSCAHTPEYKRDQIRRNVLESTYSKKPNLGFKRRDNARLRLRFKEAIEYAHDTCAEKSTDACFTAWDEVDELEDSMMRYGINLYDDSNMRYGSLLRRAFKVRWNVRNVEDHHVIPAQFKSHPIVEKVNYDIHASENIIMMPRDIIGNLRTNRHTHRGGHKAYNRYVGEVLDSMETMETPEPEFRKFVDFLKIGCRFRPQDIPWN